MQKISALGRWREDHQQLMQKQFSNEAMHELLLQQQQARTNSCVSCYTLDFVVRSWQLWLQMFQDPAILAALTTLDESWSKKNPMDSITKLLVLQRKCKSDPRKISGVLDLLGDHLCNSLVNPDGLSLVCLRGKDQKKRTGYLDLLLLKVNFLAFFVTELLNEAKFSPEESQHVRDVLKTSATYRKWAGGIPFDPANPYGHEMEEYFSESSSPIPSTAQMQSSSNNARPMDQADNYIRFVGQVIYEDKFQSSLAAALRYQHSCRHFLTLKDVSAAFNALTTQGAPSSTIPEALPACLEDEDFVDPPNLRLSTEFFKEIIGASFSGDIDWSNISKADVEYLIEVEQKARVRMLQCWFVSGDQLPHSLLASIMNHPFMTAMDSNNLLIVYDTKVFR